MTGVFSLQMAMSSGYIVYSSPQTPTVAPTSAPGQALGIVSVDETPTHVTTEEKEQITVVPAVINTILSPDTIEVEIDGRLVLIQLNGVGSPTDTHIRTYYTRYKEKLLDTLNREYAKAPVYLVSETTEDKIELEPWERYVFLENMTLLNTEIISQGHAIYERNDHNPISYDQTFTRAQVHAIEGNSGIWISPTVTQAITIQPTATPLKQPTFSPTSTPLPTTTTIPTATPTATPSPKPTTQPVIQSSSNAPVGSLNADTLFTLINEHRATKGLSPFEKHADLCTIAQSRAPQLYDEIFVTKNVHAGFYALNLPYWTTENMAHYDTESVIMKWWLNSTIHRNAIEGSHRYTCGACQGKSCVQLFSSFIPK